MAEETLQYVSRAAKNLRYRKELPFPHMRQRVSAVVWTHDPHLTSITQSSDIVRRPKTLKKSTTFFGSYILYDVKKSGRFFINILWPSQNIWTLMDLSEGGGHWPLHQSYVPCTYLMTVEILLVRIIRIIPIGLPIWIPWILRGCKTALGRKSWPWSPLGLRSIILWIRISDPGIKTLLKVWIFKEVISLWTNLWSVAHFFHSN